MIYNAGTTQLTKLQSALLKTQQQISADTRVLTPSDDPIAAARALDVKQRQALNTQYADNRTQAMNSLEQEETSLKSLTTMIQTLQTQVVEAGNASYDDTQRSYLATAMRGTLEEMFGVANTQDSSGNYLFSGYQVDTKPFTKTSTGATYSGDQGVRKMQVDTARQMVVNSSGQSVFENNAGSATFSIDSTAGTFSSGAVSSMSVSDAAAVTGHSYQVAFAVTGTGTAADPYVTTYSVTDSGVPVNDASGYPLTNVSYTRPQKIVFDGLSFTVSGTRTNGDTLTVSTVAAKDSNQSLFSTLTSLINQLETP
ncbi:MAG: flagellar hook-associated protein FlgL, partial [Burkholderiaceae bacterium]|nr:flagellar hook-associated protein FlgL [Burkholderiaceae bacterium]